MVSNNKVFWLAPIIVLAIGILPMPIGYYSLSRLVVCVCSIYYVIFFNKKKDNTNVWLFGFVALLYNPIFPVYLYEKLIWVIVNIFTIGLFYKKGRM